MDEDQRRAAIGAKLAACRKQAGLTQAQLAQRLHYSDKAVSKWERGESVPDILTLQDLAAQLGVPPQTFLEQPREAPVIRAGTPSKNGIYSLIAVGILGLGVLSLVILRGLALPGSWLGVLYALPAAALTDMILAFLWKEPGKAQVFLSLLLWGTLLSVWASFAVLGPGRLDSILLLGIPGQLIIYFSFRIRRRIPGKETHHG